MGVYIIGKRVWWLLYGYATTKKEAQREAVYDFLCYLMDIEDDYE